MLNVRFQIYYSIQRLIFLFDNLQFTFWFKLFHLDFNIHKFGKSVHIIKVKWYSYLWIEIDLVSLVIFVKDCLSRVLYQELTWKFNIFSRCAFSYVQILKKLIFDLCKNTCVVGGSLKPKFTLFKTLKRLKTTPIRMLLTC